MLERQQRQMKDGLSRKMKRLAEARRCPKCNRKSALSKRKDGEYVEVNCRYCGFSRGGFIDGPKTSSP